MGTAGLSTLEGTRSSTLERMHKFVLIRLETNKKDDYCLTIMLDRLHVIIEKDLKLVMMCGGGCGIN